MIPLSQDQVFPVSERLATEYSEDDEETRSFRQKIMQRLLSQWGDCYLAIALALLLYAFYLQGEVAGTLVLAPLIALDGKLIVQCGVWWRANEAPEQFKAQMERMYGLEVLEHSCTLLCKALLAISLSTSFLPLLSCALPLSFHLVIRFLYRETALNDCYAFSGMVRSMQFRLIWRCTRLALLLTISLKVSGAVHWPWASVFWPGWVTLSMLTLISIGVLLLVFGSFCAWVSGEVRTKEVLCVCWFLYVTSGSCGAIIALLVLISKYMDGSDLTYTMTTVLIATCFYCVSVWLSTKLLLTMLR